MITLLFLIILMIIVLIKVLILIGAKINQTLITILEELKNQNVERIKNESRTNY
jgi:hypothetical protein